MGRRINQTRAAVSQGAIFGYGWVMGTWGSLFPSVLRYFTFPIMTLLTSNVKRVSICYKKTSNGER